MYKDRIETKGVKSTYVNSSCKLCKIREKNELWVTMLDVPESVDTAGEVQAPYSDGANMSPSVPFTFSYTAVTLLV